MGERVDDHTHCEGKTLVVTVGRILLVKHVVQRGDFSVRIGNLRMIVRAHKTRKGDGLQSGTGRRWARTWIRTR